jgi:hypothetical protein
MHVCSFAIVRSWLQLISLAHKLTMYRPCFGKRGSFFFLEPDQTHPLNNFLSLTLTYFILCVVLGLGKRVVGGRVRCAQGYDKNKQTYILIGKISVLCAYPLGVKTHHTIVESVDLPVL